MADPVAADLLARACRTLHLDRTGCGGVVWAMTPEQVISWGLQAGLAILVAMWGRAQKQSDAMLVEKTATLRTHIDAMSEAHDKMLVLQLAVRDQQLLAIHGRLDKAGQKASDVGDMVTVKIADMEHRITVLETRLARMSP